MNRILYRSAFCDKIKAATKIYFVIILPRLPPPSSLPLVPVQLLLPVQLLRWSSSSLSAP